MATGLGNVMSRSGNGSTTFFLNWQVACPRKSKSGGISEHTTMAVFGRRLQHNDVRREGCRLVLYNMAAHRRTYTPASMQRLSR